MQTQVITLTLPKTFIKSSKWSGAITKWCIWQQQSAYVSSANEPRFEFQCGTWVNVFGYVTAREVSPRCPVDRLPLDAWSSRWRKSWRLAVTHRSPGTYLRVCLCVFMRVYAYVWVAAPNRLRQPYQCARFPRLRRLMASAHISGPATAVFPMMKCVQSSPARRPGLCGLCRLSSRTQLQHTAAPREPMSERFIFIYCGRGRCVCDDFIWIEGLAALVCSQRLSKHLRAIQTLLTLQ